MADIYGGSGNQNREFGALIGSKSRLFGFFLLVLAAIVWTCFYTVEAESEGVLLRFGRFVRIVEPGLHFKLPMGMEEVLVLPTRRQLKLEFGFASQGFTNPHQPGKNPVEEKSMVTGDLNAALVEWVVQYRIDNPREYLFDVRNPDRTLRDLSEAAMREVVGDRTVDEVITVGRQEIEVSALARMQDLARRYQLGIRVDGVQLKDVNPPKQVEASFNEVNKAQQDRSSAINVAVGEYNKAIPRARGQAEQTLSTAEGYRFKRVNEAEGDVASFNLQFAQYRLAPEATRTRLYLETLAEALPSAGQKIVVDEGLRQLLPVLPLQPLQPQQAQPSGSGKKQEVR
ncbi:MAG: membrane protease subunit HflK [Verrucomicrobia bacterium]|nr:MAG: membrane protease subunit HflK [Verrucomicrobiota bacterium]